MQFQSELLKQIINTRTYVKDYFLVAYCFVVHSLTHFHTVTQHWHFIGRNCSVTFEHHHFDLWPQNSGFWLVNYYEKIRYLTLHKAISDSYLILYLIAGTWEIIMWTIAPNALDSCIILLSSGQLIRAAIWLTTRRVWLSDLSNSPW
jgi:hypothetical protein